MKELVIGQLPIGWSSISELDNEKVLALNSSLGVMYAKIRLAKYIGSVKSLENMINTEYLDDSVIDCIHGEFLCSNLKWYSSYYVTTDKDKQYYAIFYALLDGYYILLKLSTNDGVLRTRFLAEAKRIIQILDCSKIKKVSQFYKGKRTFVMNTPVGYHFSQLSDNEHLVYISKGKYLFVNIDLSGQDIFSFVETRVQDTYLGMLGCYAVITGYGNEEDTTKWVRYQIIKQKGETLGTGTYFTVPCDHELINCCLFEMGQPSSSVLGLVKVRGD